MGSRPPGVPDNELVEALQAVLDIPVKNTAWTQEVAAELDAGEENVRERLEQAAADSDVPIAGDRREPGSDIWWLTDLRLYDLLGSDAENYPDNTSEYYDGDPVPYQCNECGYKEATEPGPNRTCPECGGDMYPVR